MTHLTQDRLVLHYYEPDASAREHLRECAKCRLQFASLEQSLDELRDVPVPQPSPDFERRIWHRLENQLPRRRSRWPLVVASGAVAACLLIGFGWKASIPGVVPAKENPVLREALAEHLEQTQILLREISHRTAAEGLDGEQREHARSLLEDSRLLRAVLRTRGDTRKVAALNDFEPTLLNIANGPARPNQTDWEAMQGRLQENGLAFKADVLRTNMTIRSPQ